MARFGAQFAQAVYRQNNFVVQLRRLWPRVGTGTVTAYTMILHGLQVALEISVFAFTQMYTC